MTDLLAATIPIMIHHETPRNARKRQEMPCKQVLPGGRRDEQSMRKPPRPGSATEARGTDPAEFGTCRISPSKAKSVQLFPDIIS